MLLVWFLLEPHDYLSTYIKLGTIALLFIVGVALVLIETARRCWKTLRGHPIPEEAFG